MLANIHRRKGAAAFKPADFTPYTELDKQRERAEAASTAKHSTAERFANILSHAGSSAVFNIIFGAKTDQLEKAMGGVQRRLEAFKKSKPSRPFVNGWANGAANGDRCVLV